MNAKLIREIIKLIRAYFRLQAEARFLAAMLQTAELMDQPPIKWLEALKQARNLPDYRKISEQHSEQLSELEESADANELSHFLESIPPTEFLN
jgi:hypothetical protein